MQHVFYNQQSQPHGKEIKTEKKSETGLVKRRKGGSFVFLKLKKVEKSCVLLEVVVLWWWGEERKQKS